MKTNDLINLMSEDAPVRLRLGRGLTLALLFGSGFSAVLMLSTIGIRPNMGQAIETARVLFKVCMTGVLAIVATRLVFSIGRPGMPIKARVTALGIPAAMLAVAVIVELLVVPSGDWSQLLLGRNAAFCTFFIPVLSTAPLALFIVALRNGAPEHPPLAGAAAGLAASGIAAAIYAWHCPDDSPLFGAVWYMLTITMVTGVGSLLGARLLKW